MSKVLRLDDEWEYSEIVLYGIVSELPAYRLCYYLNESLNLRLTRSGNDRVRSYKKMDLHYEEFCCESKGNGLFWKLLANKNPRVYENEVYETISGLPLISEYAIMDYLLYYEEGPNEEAESIINTKLKELSYVRTFSKLDMGKVKNVENLLIN